MPLAYGDSTFALMPAFLLGWFVSSVLLGLDLLFGCNIIQFVHFTVSQHLGLSHVAWVATVP